MTWFTLYAHHESELHTKQIWISNMTFPPIWWLLSRGSKQFKYIKCQGSREGNILSAPSSWRVAYHGLRGLPSRNFAWWAAMGFRVTESTAVGKLTSLGDWNSDFDQPFQIEINNVSLSTSTYISNRMVYINVTKCFENNSLYYCYFK